MNLLTEPLLRVETAAGLERMTLPGLLAALGEDRVEALTGIQRHQEEAFHVFLCSLATTILARNGDHDPVQSETYWRDGLRGLASAAGDDAWTLVVEDLSKPAFMQPPCTGMVFSKISVCPDAFDTTEIAKNHDLKLARGEHTEPDLWVYVLVSSNMNAAYSKGGRDGFYFATPKAKKNRVGRVYVRPTIAGKLGRQWFFDVACLLAYRSSLLDKAYGYSADGILLTWTWEWRGKPQLQFRDLDPFFLETTRQHRLFVVDGGIEGRLAPSTEPLIYCPPNLVGNVGDPYVPIDASDDSAVSVSDRGWRADLLRAIVFEESIQSPLLRIAKTTTREGLLLRCSSIARSRRGTEGCHFRDLPIPKAALLFFNSSRSEVEPVAEISRAAVAEVTGKIEWVISTALLAYLHVSDSFRDAKTKRLDWTDKKWRKKADEKHGPWLRRSTGPMAKFSHRWSDAYFPWLWRVIATGELSDEEGRNNALDQWALTLREEALQVLHESMDTLPRHAGRQWLPRVETYRVFHQAFYSKNNFLHLKEYDHARTANA